MNRIIGLIFCTMALSIVAHAKVTATDSSGNSVSLKVKGARTNVKVAVEATIAPNSIIKIFYDTTVLGAKCSGQEVATLNGSSISWAKTFVYAKMHGTLMYVSACMYDVVDGKAYLVRELSDFDYVQGID